jgi:hypothetical protein
MTDTRYAETATRVYREDSMDRDATPMQRAMHDELCNNLPPDGLHGPHSAMPMCWRAALVARTVSALALKAHLGGDGIPPE